MEKVTGITIRTVKYSESDEILTILTKEKGKISARARGSKKTTSKIGVGVGFLCYSEFVISGGPDMYYINQCTPIKNFFDAGADIERLSLATYLGQLTAELIISGEEHEETLSLFLNTLYVMTQTDKDLKMIKAAFELRVMSIEGFLPAIITCAYCGEKNFPMYFDIKEGAIYCSKCKNKGYLITENLFSAIQYIIYSDSKKIFSFTLTENILSTLCDMAENYVIYHLGKTLRSLEYLRNFL